MVCSIQNLCVCILLCLGFACLSTSASAVETRKRPIDEIALDTGTDAPTTDKIIGGTQADPGKFPFQVALIASRTPPGREMDGQFCGGALIAKRWVLTAAHCVPNTSAEEIDIYMGSTVLPNDGRDAGGQRRSVKRVLDHQKYNDDTKDNDIALLELVEDAPMDLTPTTVASEADAEALLLEGAPVTVIGWGRTSEGGQRSAKLMEVTIDIQSSIECEENYKRVIPSTGQIITKNMFCAGAPEVKKDSCQGDSGGFIGTLKDNNWVQLGVVSWGVGCARPKLYGVYTQAPNYWMWIESAMR